jgi:hypothetical protein
MDSIFSKLNYKEGVSIYVINHPETFNAMLDTVPSVIEVRKAIPVEATIGFVIGFITQKSDLEMFVRKIVPLLQGDAILWLAYPKGTSKKYKCDFNRDTSWQVFTVFNVLPVRQVSIDDDWSALRFRKAEYIKTLTRKGMQ